MERGMKEGMSEGGRGGVMNGNEEVDERMHGRNKEKTEGYG